MMDVFSTRELASAFWLIITIFIMFMVPSLRRVIPDLIKTLMNKYILIPLGILLLYSIIVIKLVSFLPFWEWMYIKDVLLWVLFVGIPFCFGAVTTKESNYLKGFLMKNLTFIIVVEFLISSFTFNIYVELIQIPVIMFLILLDTVAGTKKEYRQVKKLTSYIISYMGILALCGVVNIIITNYNTINSLDLFITFIIPILLSILFIPIAYCYLIYSKYEQLFILIKVLAPTDKSFRIMCKWEIAKLCKFSPKRVVEFRDYSRGKINRKISRDDFKNIISKFKEINAA